MKMFENCTGYELHRDQQNGYYGEHQPERILYPFINALLPEESPMHLEYNIKEYVNPGNVIGSTATSKGLIFNTELDEDSGEWRHKERREWSSRDVLEWIASVAATHGFPCEEVNVRAFKIEGKALLSMTIKDFVERDEKYGHLLYESLHLSQLGPSPPFHSIPKKEIKLETLSSSSSTRRPPYSLVDLHRQPKTFHTDLDMGNSSESYPFNLDAVKPEEDQGETGYSSERKNSVESNSSSSSSDTELSDYEVKQVKKKVVAPGKRPPGRPPGVKTKKDKPEKKTGRLWEFIRDLLLDPQYCPSVICWENHDDGVFRFVKSEKVAKIWGTRKGNDKMNYEKLSRAMRYYYRSKVLQPVIGRRLVYKFGPTARGWQTENPNFRH